MSSFKRVCWCVASLRCRIAELCGTPALRGLKGLSHLVIEATLLHAWTRQGSPTHTRPFPDSTPFITSLRHLESSGKQGRLGPALIQTLLCSVHTTIHFVALCSLSHSFGRPCLWLTHCHLPPFLPTPSAQHTDCPLTFYKGRWAKAPLPPRSPAPLYPAGC